MPVILALIVMTGCGKQNTKARLMTVEPKAATSSTYEAPDAGPAPAQPQKVQQVKLYFEDINFDLDKYTLRPDACKILSSHAKVIQGNSQIKLRIEGHCDERGTIEYNLALGEKRADAVKRYLVNYGIKPESLSTISYGKESVRCRIS